MCQTVTITPAQNKSFTSLPVCVEEGTKEIQIHFVYHPLMSADTEAATQQVAAKIHSYANELPSNFRCPPAVLKGWEVLKENPERFVPLKNHMNFSLYDPNGKFWGRWDSPQFYDKWITVGQNSSRGFSSGTLPSGQWVVELEAHGIYSPSVEAFLQVELVRYEHQEWFRGEMHSHTNHSDGAMNLEQLCQEAHAIGLDFLVLSDHNTMTALEHQVCSPPLTVISGLELSTFYGHAVLAGLEKYVDWRTRSPHDSLKPAFDAKDASTGLFIVAHPFAVGDPLCCGCEWKYDNIDYSRVDAVEIWSGSWRKNALFNWRAIQWWEDLLCAGHKITAVAARDVHQPNQFAHQDSADTVVKSWDTQPQHLLASISQGQVCLSTQGTLDLIIEDGNGDRYGMGDTLSPHSSAHLRCIVNITDAKEDGILEVICDGELVSQTKTIVGNSQGELSIDKPKRFCRVQLLEDNPQRTPMMFSNPVYFEGR